jgi:hypothetical protein
VVFQAGPFIGLGGGLQRHRMRFFLCRLLRQRAISVLSSPGSNIHSDVPISARDSSVRSNSYLKPEIKEFGKA